VNLILACIGKLWSSKSKKNWEIEWETQF
jgi:hypothetical protein